MKSVCYWAIVARSVDKLNAGIYFLAFFPEAFGGATGAFGAAACTGSGRNSAKSKSPNRWAKRAICPDESSRTCDDLFHRGWFLVSLVRKVMDLGLVVRIENVLPSLRRTTCLNVVGWIRCIALSLIVRCCTVLY